MPPNPLPTSPENAQYGIWHTSPLVETRRRSWKPPRTVEIHPHCLKLPILAKIGPLGLKNTPPPTQNVQLSLKTLPHLRKMPFQF